MSQKKDNSEYPYGYSDASFYLNPKSVEQFMAEQRRKKKARKAPRKKVARKKPSETKYRRDARNLLKAYRKGDHATMKRILGRYQGVIDPTDTIDMAISTLELLDFEAKHTSRTLANPLDPVTGGILAGAGSFVGQEIGRQIWDKPMAPKKNPYQPLPPVLEDVMALSDGTLATLTGRTKYEDLYAIQQDLVAFVQEALKKKKLKPSDTWMKAWSLYQGATKNPKLKKVKVGKAFENPAIRKVKKPARTWTGVGKEYSKGDKGRRRIVKEIKTLHWQKLPVELGFMPGDSIKAVISDLRLPKVSHVAVGSLGPMGFYGIRAHYKDGMAQIYVIDDGVSITPVASDFWKKK